MDKKEEIFHRAFFGRFNKKILYGSSKLREVNPWTSELVAIKDFFRFIENFRKANSKAPIPYVSIVNSGDLNAAATKFEGHYFIGLFEGTIRYLYDLFGMMLCSPEILPDIGNPSKEEKLPPIYNAQFTDYHKYIAANGFTNYQPKCEIRSEARMYLFTTTLLTILLHEYGHVLHGHTDLKNNRKLHHSIFFEVMDSQEALTPAEALFSQTLEYDADSFAYSIEYSMIAPWNFNKNDLKNQSSRLFIKSADEALRLFTFANYTWHRIFGMFNYDELDLFKLSHPPANIRQDDLFSIVYTHNKYLSSIEEGNRLTNEMRGFVEEVEKAFSIISEQPFNKEAFDLASSEKYAIHHEIIRQNWKNVRPHLIPFTHVELTENNNKK